MIFFFGSDLFPLRHLPLSAQTSRGGVGSHYRERERESESERERERERVRVRERERETRKKVVRSVGWVSTFRSSAAAERLGGGIRQFKGSGLPQTKKNKKNVKQIRAE